MKRAGRWCLAMVLAAACAGDQIASSPPKEDMLLWRANRMYVVSAPEIARGGTQAVTLPDVHDIADVDDAANTLAISAVPNDLRGCKLLVGMPASGFRELLAIPSAVPALAISSDASHVGYSRFAGNAAAYDIYVYDTNGQRAPQLIGSKLASPTGSLSFRSNRSELTFEDTQGRISTIDLRTGQVSPLLRGQRPRWSRDGSRLAYRNDEAVYVYDAAGKKSTIAYRRSAADGNFDGGLFWSKNDRFVAFNLNVGVDAPNRQCVVIDTQTARVALAVTTPYLCGPFVGTSGK